MQQSQSSRSTPFSFPAYVPPTPATERELLDGGGDRWIVREVKLAETSFCMPRLFTRLGYEDGWLTFRAAHRDETYRIAPVPSNWRTMSDFELERWLMRARFEARRRAERKVERRA